jgi:hypothetical protein
MTERYFFFDDYIDGEFQDIRQYGAAEFALVFQQMIASGFDASTLGSGISRYNPFATDPTAPNLQVTANGENMIVTIGAGAAFIAGRAYFDDAAKTKVLGNANSTQDRIDRIVLRLDLHDRERKITCEVKPGQPSSSPARPGLQNDEFIKEISLAAVTVRAGKSFISPADVRDERSYSELGGYLPLHNLMRGIQVTPSGAVVMPNQSFIKTQVFDYQGFSINEGYTDLPIPGVMYDKQSEVSGNRFIPKNDGVYNLWFEIGCRDELLPADAYVQLYVYVNGVESFPLESRTISHSRDRYFIGSGFDQLMAGDIVTFKARSTYINGSKPVNLIRFRAAKIS